ncbi:TPA: hypothetical protein PVD34_004851, partial [Escherichia coli]|nr:hypothetical protein [Escherichia coli]
TIFISGSAEKYGDLERPKALDFIHTLAYEIIKNNYRIVNGFGWGVGSSVINGALDAIYSRPDKLSEEQLIVRPFPQTVSKGKDIQELWEEYRQRMIPLGGIALFIFGNKQEENNDIVNARGVFREFEIAVQHGLVPIPLPNTGYMSKYIFEQIS